MGVIGALGGAVIGMIGWALLIRFTGYEIGFAAWGVGIITGFGSLLLSGGGNTTKGVIAGILAVLAILGGQYFAVKHQLDRFVDEYGEQLYAYEMDLAKAVDGADPERLRELVAYDNSDDENELSAADVTEEMVWEFRENRLPQLAAILDGSMTEYDFLEKVKTSIRENVTMVDILKDSFSIFTLLWIALGVGSAFKIAAGRGD